VATPETGIDSVSVSYALLGPVFAIYRPIAAIMSAIITGLLVATIKEEDIKSPHDHNTSGKTSCCDSKPAVKTEELPKSFTSCCASKKVSLVKPENIFISKTKEGVYYASTKLIDDIIIWLFVGLLFASLIRTFLPEEFLLSYGSGLPAMLLMIIISIPMYICATASTPIAAGFILAGLSPGTALVFMMAGPATNISTLGVIRNEMGSTVLIRYLLGVSLCALGFALLLDFSLSFYDVNISEQMQHSHELLPKWFGLSCTGLITFLSIKPLRRVLIK